MNQQFKTVNGRKIPLPQAQGGVQTQQQHVPYAIINGKRVPVPNGQITGQELLNQMGGSQGGRRPVVQEGMAFEVISPSKNYNLKGKKGQSIKAQWIPERTKGSFFAVREQFSKQLIAEQVYDIALHLFKSGVSFDEQNADWMVVSKYVLPPIWHDIAETTELMVVFPTEYPVLPPIGFYIRGDIANAPDGHLYPGVYHEAAKEPIEAGWKWFCVYIQPGSWRPSRNWRKGDNLWTYFTMISEVLASRGA